MDSMTQVQILTEAVTIAHNANTLWGRQEWISSTLDYELIVGSALALVQLPVQEKEDTEFKPVK